MKRMVDVAGGKMTLKQINDEIWYVMLAKTPKRLIVDIKRTGDGYHSTIYIDEKSFRKEE